MGNAHEKGIRKMLLECFLENSASHWWLQTIRGFAEESCGTEVVSGQDEQGQPGLHAQARPEIARQLTPTAVGYGKAESSRPN